MGASGWESAPRKKLTLVVPYADDAPGGERLVLLGMKKRGFGEGLYNGFGGKVEEHDGSVAAAAVRELQEESALESSEAEMGEARVGVLLFVFTDDGESAGLVVWEVHVFFLNVGAARLSTARASEEMTAETFTVGSIPMDKMWEDDPLWYPVMLSGGRFTGVVRFTNREPVDGRKQLPKMTEHDIREVASLPSCNT